MKPKITTSGQYKNINLKELDPEESIVIEKIFNEGMQKQSKFQIEGKPTAFNYIVKAKYDGEEVTFWLNDENTHDAFKKCGEVGSQIKITCKLVPYTFKNAKKYKSTFVFTEVQ